MTVNNLSPCVLIIAPYSKRFGIAVFRNFEPIDFGVKSFQPRGKSCAAESDTVIQNLIREFRPTKILLKKPSYRQTAGRCQQDLAQEVKRASEVAHIRFREVSFGKVKQALCRSRRPTNSDVFASINVHYPGLANLTRFQNRWQREYYTPLLSAIAIGLAFQKS